MEVICTEPSRSVRVLALIFNESRLYTIDNLMATNILHVYDIICFRNKIPNKSFFDECFGR